MTIGSEASVCVIGAGVAGLATGKRLGDYGVDYRCFEGSDRVGGNWAFRNPNGQSSAYFSLHIDTSKAGLALRDFPMSDAYPDYPHHSQIKEYLDQYADAFDLKSKISFETSVTSATQRLGGGWNVATSDGERHEFDYLAVANGHHWDPRTPDFPGSFDGDEIHSHAYIGPREPLDLFGKRVLVVGIGNSAADIACEISRKGVADRVCISTRSGAWVLPKYAFGRPGDTLFRTKPYLPLKWQRKAAQRMAIILSGRMERYGLPTPDHPFLSAHPTISSELLIRLSSGDLIPKPNVQRLDGRAVQFVDDTREEFDAIIYATGYNITFPFFDPALISAPNNKIRLFKRIFAPNVPDLAFVGFAQAIPSLFPFVELQAGVVARHVVGEYRLPSPAEMERAIDQDEAKFVKHYSDKPRHTQQLEYPIYEHDMRTRELPEGRRRAQAAATLAEASR